MPSRVLKKAILPFPKGVGVAIGVGVGAGEAGAGVGVDPAFADPVMEKNATVKVQSNSTNRLQLRRRSAEG